MEHHFNVEVAKQFGIEEAIILNNIYFWVYKNKTNNKNYYDGNYWTYNSKKAYKEQFPYMAENRIKTALSNLRKYKMIITGNYNKYKYDKTLWYSITEYGCSILGYETLGNTDWLKSTNGIKSNQPIDKIISTDGCNYNQPMDKLDSSIALDEIIEPIPYNKPYNKNIYKNHIIKDINKFVKDKEIINSINNNIDIQKEIYDLEIEYNGSMPKDIIELNLWQYNFETRVYLLEKYAIESLKDEYKDLQGGYLKSPQDDDSPF